MTETEISCGNGEAPVAKSGRPMPPSTSFPKQVVVYLVSFFLAPFGLWYAWKYLQQEGGRSKAIGVIAIALTVLAVAVAIWTTRGMVELVQQSLRLLRESGL